MPSHDTFSRIFRLLDPTAFGECFGRFVEQLGMAGQGVLAIDGKTLRRSFDRAAKTSALQVVTAFACKRRMVLGQTAVPAGENEITAARTLLRSFDLTGSPRSSRRLQTAQAGSMRSSWTGTGCTRGSTRVA